MEGRYTIDASIVVKWLNQNNEESTTQALSVLEGCYKGAYSLLAPELCIMEVSNALLRGKGLSGKKLEKAVDLLFIIPIQYVSLTQDRTQSSILISESSGMTFYDALYVAIALEHHAPLITANVKHQQKFRKDLVVDIKTWKV